MQEYQGLYYRAVRGQQDYGAKGRKIVVVDGNFVAVGQDS